MKKRSFPEGFLWGAATSSHQVEGGNYNNWTEWEKNGYIKNNDQSGRAADHWNLYEADYDLLEKLNLNAYRLSVEWSRIEPEPGEFDNEAIKKYQSMLENLKKRNITACVTLHHFTNPVWTGDWAESYTVERYLQYVEQTVQALGAHTSIWCTINEPNVLVSLGYYMGQWPPGKRSVWSSYKALRNLRKAHKHAYSLIHSIYRQNNWPKPQVGMAFNLQYFEPAGANPLWHAAATLGRYITNRYNLNRVRGSLDFVGVNYYFAHKVKLNPFVGYKNDLPKTDVGWDVCPEGLYHVLKDLRRYNLPILVTENGLADAKDSFRKQFITMHIKAMHRAIEAGAKVIGYMHWSLIDNFEWLDGFSGRFGLVEVDFDTQKRTVRESAKAYAQIAKTNTLSAGMIKDLP